MTKTHRTEIIEEYDANGKLVRKTTTEETEESNDPTPTWNDNWWTQHAITYADHSGKACNHTCQNNAYTTAENSTRG